MIFQRLGVASIFRSGQFNHTSRNNGFVLGHTFLAISQMPPNSHAVTGSVKKFKIDVPLDSILQNLGSIRMPTYAFLPYSFCCRMYTQPGQQAYTQPGRQAYLQPGPQAYRPSGPQAEFETQRTNRSIDYAQELLLDNRIDRYGNSMYAPRKEGNADIVHIKLMRNNAFVTLTDSKGNKKLGTSAGKLAGKGGILTRYSAEAPAEDIGQKVRQMKTKSVVVKVNGSTLFRKKKLAILSFRDGYSNSRPDVNPIVYIEDTTRKPHNGCRLKKKRRI